MSKTPSLTPKELIRLLEQKALYLIVQKGSHQIYFNKEKKLRVVIPMHNKDLPTETLRAILKQADIDKNNL